VSTNAEEISNRLGYILNYKTPPEPRPELGEFWWNGKVAAAVHEQRRRWLLHGGVFLELMRFLRSDLANKRHFIARLQNRIGHQLFASLVPPIRG
jgi:hypothetical protein